MERIKFDLKDKKILAELDFNARESVARIARKVRLSKEVTLYRIRKLERKGIIKQYYAVINSAKLGYRYCRIYVKFQNITKKIETNIINWLRGNPNLAYLGIGAGFWDMLLGCWVKDMTEFKEFIDEFVFRYGKHILEKEISVGLYLWQFPYRVLWNQKGVREFKTGGVLGREEVDKIDRKILILLTKNARMSLMDISREVHLSSKAVQYRIKRLMKRKIIAGFRTLVEYKKLGYSNNKVLLYLQNLTKEEFTRLINYLKSLSPCIYITQPIGKPDLEFEVLTKDREEFFSIIQDLREEFRSIIRSYDHFIIHEELVSRFIPLIS